MDAGLKIRMLREKHGLKQVNLANALQVSPQAVSKWERGANYPDMDVLIRIARLFDVSLDYLLGITDPEPGIFEATVFCSSITHFARRSITMDSRALADYANMVFYPLTESVLSFDGIPVKYVGDGFLCFFSGPTHRDRALAAAIRAKKAVGLKDLVIALHTGDIYLGRMGHPDYGARDIIGETVNKAFLVAGWVSRHCASGIGATKPVLEKAEKTYEVIPYEGAQIDLMDERLDIYEVAESIR